MAIGIKMPAPSKTHDRAAKGLSRVLVDLGVKKQTTSTSLRVNKYPMIMRDDFSRFAWMHFVFHKYSR